MKYQNYYDYEDSIFSNSHSIYRATILCPEDDLELVGDLSECTTIDSEITKKCSDLLEKGLKELNSVNELIAWLMKY